MPNLHGLAWQPNHPLYRKLVGSTRVPKRRKFPAARLANAERRPIQPRQVTVQFGIRSDGIRGIAAVGADRVWALPGPFCIAREMMTAVGTYHLAMNAQQGFGHGATRDATWHGQPLEEPQPQDRHCHGQADPTLHYRSKSAASRSYGRRPLPRFVNVGVGAHRRHPPCSPKPCGKANPGGKGSGGRKCRSPIHFIAFSAKRYSARRLRREGGGLRVSSLAARVSARFTGLPGSACGSRLKSSEISGCDAKSPRLAYLEPGVNAGPNTASRQKRRERP